MKRQRICFVSACLLTLVLRAASLGAQTNLLQSARACDRFDKEGYNRDKAVLLYEEYIASPDVSLTERIKVLHRIAELYSYAAKPGEADTAKAAMYYTKMLDISDGKINEDIIFARSNLISLENATVAEQSKRRWLFILWSMEQLVDAENMPSRLIYPDKATEEQRKKCMLDIGCTLVALQDSAMEAAHGDNYCRSIQEAFRPFFAGSDMAGGGKERIRQFALIVQEKFAMDKAATRREMRPESAEKPDGVKIDEGGAITAKVITANLSQEGKDRVTMRHKWAIENPEAMNEINKFNVRLPELMKTQEGKNEALEWLETHSRLWEGSPHERETLQLMEQLKAVEH